MHALAIKPPLPCKSSSHMRWRGGGIALIKSRVSMHPKIEPPHGLGTFKNRESRLRLVPRAPHPLCQRATKSTFIRHEYKMLISEGKKCSEPLTTLQVLLSYGVKGGLTAIADRATWHQEPRWWTRLNGSNVPGGNARYGDHSTHKSTSIWALF